MGARLLFAFAVSALLGALGYRRQSLSSSGVAGALFVGTLTLGLGGAAWGVLLGIFFFSSSLLSHYKEKEKAMVADKFAKGHRRDFGQTMANGGLGSLAAVGAALLPSPLWFQFFVGIMATVTADTWATELGTLSRQPPRLITTGRRVPVGTSGAISPLGTAISLLGGLVIGLSAGLLARDHRLRRLAVIGAAAGLAGSLFDSLLGATVQRVYYCDRCGKETERRRHRCGHESRPLRGWFWLNNDLVNLLASAVGGLCAVALWALLACRRQGR
ncbi:MAG: DUF92 domain-containing protein [Candidatus Promineifilaceae bacterium]|nr:DUF92 domain-containing protein [Candidatus Promineifilaceae bacterium]